VGRGPQCRPTPLDVGGFFLSDGDSVPRYAFSGVIAPGDHYVVFGSESFAWEHAHGWPAFGLSLANSGDQVLLWQVVGADTVLVDGYTYRSHEAASDRAVGRAQRRWRLAALRRAKSLHRHHAAAGQPLRSDASARSTCAARP
jgi:hypothetical protein